MTTDSTAKIVVRRATPDDLPDVVQLLSARDGLQRTPRSVAEYLWGLDPKHTACWLAYRGETPVGITFLYFREMRWPKELDGSESAPERLTAGYWAHLYVEPDFRKQMVYPQLVLAMLRGMRATNLSVIFTATRQPAVAEAHQKLGFHLVGTLPLRLRPLRPFRLVAKHKGQRALVPLSAPLDWLVHPILRRKLDSSLQLEDVDLHSSQVETIVSLMNTCCPQAVRQRWTIDLFRRRFSTALDGTDYRLRIVRRDGQISAAAVLALAERGNAIRAGVLLVLVHSETGHSRDAPALLADAEDFAYANQAELVLALGDSLSGTNLDTGLGKYLTNHSETYHMLVYPKQKAQAPYLAANLNHWLFQFADHDAF